MSVLIISDLHLSTERPDVLQGFVNFKRRLLKAAPNRIESLYILGDLCEVWLGDDDKGPLACQLRQWLSEISAQMSLFLMHGNRDFLIGHRFEAETGATLIPDPYSLVTAGRRYLLTHGDALCIDDLDYMALRSLVRNSDWQQQFLARPLKQRRRLAHSMRERSITATTTQHGGIMDVNQGEVRKLMQRYDSSVLVHGHTHRPGLYNFDSAGIPCRRLVLGDWNHCGWALELSAAGERMTCFSLRQTQSDRYAAKEPKLTIGA